MQDKFFQRENRVFLLKKNNLRIEKTLDLNNDLT